MNDFQGSAEKLLRERAVLESEIRKLGGKSPMVTLDAYAQVRELVLGFREMEEKSKEMDNADIAVRYKFAHKAKKSGKEFWRAVREINDLHAKGQLEEGDAKQFGKVLEKLKANKPKEAEAELSKFRRLESLDKELRRSNESIRALAGEIGSRINQLEKELSESEEGQISQETVRLASKHADVQGSLSIYNSWRESQVQKLKGMPAHRLVKACSNGQLFSLGMPKPKDEFSFDELGDFLASAKIDSNPAEVLRLSDLPPNDLKKIASDQHLFRRLANENSDWLSSVASLERTEFLTFDFGNEDKKKAILLAVEASGEESAIREARTLAGITHSEYEQMKHASSSLSRSNSSRKETGPKDNEKLKLEILVLKEIPGQLPQV